MKSILILAQTVNKFGKWKIKISLDLTVSLSSGITLDSMMLWIPSILHP